MMSSPHTSVVEPDSDPQRSSQSENTVTITPQLSHSSLEKSFPDTTLDDSAFEVKFDGKDDQENVKLWSSARKWCVCLLLTSACFELTALSSAWSIATDDIMQDFHVGREVSELGLSLYLIGLCVGPLLLAPLSEFYGRRHLYTLGLVIFFAFQFCSAFPNNIATALIGRFFVSMGGSVFMSNIPGTFADIFTPPRDLGLAMTIFTLGPFLGPGVGPVVAGFIVQHTWYRWIFFVFIIWTFVEMVAIITIVPETFAPALLKKKAARLRKQTGDDRYYAPLERADKNVIRLIKTSCTRPIILLISEPMLLLLCFYTGFLLSVVYLFFVAFPMVFTEVYNFEIEFVGLSFLGVITGMIIGAFFFPFWARLHQRDVARNGGVALPEHRLPQMCVGSLFPPIGLFMFAWTVYRSVHWMVPIVASGIFGLGCYMTMNAIFIYTVEAYRTYAASANAANVFVRCLMSAAAPLFGVQMLDAMGFHWGISLLAFVSVALCPSAFVLYKYGEAIRKRSKHAYS